MCCLNFFITKWTIAISYWYACTCLSKFNQICYGSSYTKFIRCNARRRSHMRNIQIIPSTSEEVIGIQMFLKIHTHQVRADLNRAVNQTRKKKNCLQMIYMNSRVLSSIGMRNKQVINMINKFANILIVAKLLECCSTFLARCHCKNNVTCSAKNHYHSTIRSSIFCALSTPNEVLMEFFKCWASYPIDEYNFREWCISICHIVSVP